MPVKGFQPKIFLWPRKGATAKAGFIADIHLESYQRFVPDAEVVGSTRAMGKGSCFCEQTRPEQSFDDLEKAIATSGCEVVDICLLNFLHHQAVLTAAKHGSTSLSKSPFAMTLEQADEMIEVCDKAGLKLMYAEELCFAPKYERVRQLVHEGALGDLCTICDSAKNIPDLTATGFMMSISQGAGP